MVDDKNGKDSMEVDLMGLNILLAIIGLIVGLGLGFMVAKSRHEKEIAGAKTSAASILEGAKKEAETLKKKHCWKLRKKIRNIVLKLKVS